MDQHQTTRPSLLKRFVWPVVRVYALLLVVVFGCQRCFIYHDYESPLIERESDFQIQRDGETLHVSCLRHEGSRAVIYFGGNAEDVSASLNSLSRWRPKASLFAGHYRGYGKSSGSPSEEVLIADALALFDRVSKDHQTITIVGRSLGSGVATAVAAERPASQLILITPFDRLATPAFAAMPIFPVRWMLFDRFESVAKAPQINTPTLILAADQDRIIPRESWESLAAAFPSGVAKLIVFPGVGHNTIQDHPDFAKHWAPMK